MKRFIQTLVFLVTLCITAGVVYAETTDIYKKMGTVEQMDIELCELSIAKTVSSNDAYIILNSYIEAKDKKSYTVSYEEADGESHYLGTFTAEPFLNQKTKFSLAGIKNGIHNLTIYVTDGPRIAASKSIKLNVMDQYEHQFMDQLCRYGMNVHLNDSGERDYDDIEIQRLAFAGCKSIRESIQWMNVELSRGAYSWGKNRPNQVNGRGIDGFNEYIQKFDISHYRILGYANENYVFFKEDDPNNIKQSWIDHGLPWWANIMMPNMPDGLMGWKNYVKANVEHWGTDKYEMLNENWGAASIFPEKAGRTTVYDTVVKFATMGKIQSGTEGYNSSFEAFQTDQAQHWFIIDSLEQGIYPYVNAVASHAYTHPGDPDKNDGFRRIIRQTDQNMTDYGGWKTITLSEVGWSNKYEEKPAYPMVNAEDASTYLTKNFVLADDVNIDATYWYVYNKYRLTEEAVQKKLAEGNNDPEYNFGLFDIQYEPKPTYVAYTELNRRLSGSVYVGEVDLGYGENQKAFLYAKDGKPVLVTWYYDGEKGENSIKFDETVEAYDRYGNFVYRGDGEFTVGNGPMYVYGLSNDWFAKSIQYNLPRLNKDYMSQYAEEFDDSFAAEINKVFKNAENELNAGVTAESLVKIAKSYEELGNKIIKQGADGKISQLTVSKTLYKLYRIIQKIANAYVPMYEGEVPTSMESDIKPLTEKVNSLYREKHRLMQYSDEMYRFAKKHVDNFETVAALEENPQKAGVLKSYDLLAGILIDWTDAFTDYEDIIRYAVFTHVPYPDTEVTSGFKSTIDLSIFNFETEEINAYVEITDPDGNVVAKTETAKIDPDSYKTMPVSLVVNQVAGVETYNYKAKVYDENGEFIYDSVIAFTVKDSLKLSVQPIKGTVDEASTLAVNVSNTSNEDLDLVLSVKSDENITFAQSNVTFSVKKGETVTVNIPISSINNTEYHYYTFAYTLSETNGNVICSGNQPVNFATIVKAKNPINVKEYNDEDWKDAYPVYLNSPQEANSVDAWKSSNCAARVLYKWDENNLYVLADVYDNRLYNTLTKSDMWNGDCVQMSFDPNNDRTKAYDANDLEMGFAKTTLGNSVHVWQTPTPYTGSETPDWLNIVRDDDGCVTRYMIAIPSSVIPGVKLQSDSVFGHNIGVNDADSLYRDNWIQLTNGTIDSKNPSLYVPFILKDSEDKELIPSLAGTIFSGKIVSNEKKIIPFTDVYGHWAENQIASLYERGIVNGKTDISFDPEGSLTRAEYMQMAAMTLGKSTGALYEVYDDVSADEWYAEAVQVLHENNVIPEAMTEENMIFPDKEITREEAAVIAVNVYKALRSTTIKNADLSSIPDGCDVSEWAAEGVAKAMGLGLIEGSDNGEITPRNLLTRAEGATVIFKLLLKIS